MGAPDGGDRGLWRNYGPPSRTKGGALKLLHASPRATRRRYAIKIHARVPGYPLRLSFQAVSHNTKARKVDRRIQPSLSVEGREKGCKHAQSRRQSHLGALRLPRLRWF